MLYTIDKHLRRFAAKHYFERVLNVGAKNENFDFFKNPKTFFNAREYVGIDLRKGDWVDVVMDVKDLKFPEKYFDCVVCTETFEHVDNPFKAASEIERVLRPWGYLFFTVPFNFPFHDYPSDYWRFTPEGVNLLFKGLAREELYFNGDEKNPATIIAIYRNIIQEKVKGG